MVAYQVSTEKTGDWMIQVDYQISEFIKTARLIEEKVNDLVDRLNNGKIKL